MAPHKLTISGISASRVPRADEGSESDPYVRFVILGQDGYLPTAVRTSVLKDEANPSWPDTLSLTLTEGWKGSKMKIVVWDHDHHGEDDSIGEKIVTLIPTGPESVTSTLTLTGSVEAGRGGYKFPDFQLTYTYSAVPDLGLIDRCLSCLKPNNLDTAKDLAALQIQNAAASYLGNKRAQRANVAKPAAPQDDPSKPPGHFSTQRSKTRLGRLFGSKSKDQQETQSRLKPAI